MATVGRALLILALACSVYGVGASLAGARLGVTGRGAAWAASGRRAVWVLSGLLTIAFGILEAAFLRSDFSFSLVASHSSLTTPAFYKATAAWSSQEGSLLLWVWLLSVWSSIVLFTVGRRLREIAPIATAVLLGFAAFFCSLLVFAVPPFVQLANAPADGTGLNPLLRHPSMMFHPPMLYSGYTLFAVPFAFAIGALVTRRVGPEWIRATRRFALAAWFFLGVGILLGARWSYTELGWGGYWGWDAVENASLLPWLTGTAFIHSIMVQEKRGMLKTWNASLVLATGILAIMGTFLVRSGILDSIHAFGGSTLGGPFLGLIVLMIGGSVALVVTRRASLKTDYRLESLLSREAIFLVQNLILVGLAFAIWWGTFFPLISEALTGTRHSLGPPWFDHYTVPFALLLVLLTGIGPLLAWRRASWASARHALTIPFAIGIATLVLLSVLTPAARKPLALIMFGLAAVVLGGVAQELVRGTRARRAMSGEAVPSALVSLIRRNRRRYGGYTVHAGMALLFIGVAASSAFQHHTEVLLKPGQTTAIDGYRVTFVKPTVLVGSEKISLGAVLNVAKGGHHVTTLHTTRGFYPDQTLGPFQSPISRFFTGEPTSEVGLKAGLTRDIWADIDMGLGPLQKQFAFRDKQFVAATKVIQNQRQLTAFVQARDGVVGNLARQWVRHPWAADLNLIVSPMVSWIWLGGIVVFLGGLLALWPTPEGSRRRAGAAYRARIGRELADARRPAQTA
jgi:cytochrome c-type biogenesis protein CcmF